jgi:hypothetical protein
MKRITVASSLGMACLGLAAAGCSDLFEPSCERGQFVTVGLGTGAPAVMFPGDRTDPWASLAKGNRSEPACATLVYATWTGSRDFTWRSSNPAAVSIASGTVTANGLGGAWITGTTSGLSDSIHIMVAPRVATLRVRAVPEKARPGDTVVVTVEPFDAAGNLVADAYLYGPDFVRPSPYPTWLPGKSALSGRFVMPSAATMIRTSAPHFRSERWAEVTVTPP